MFNIDRAGSLVGGYSGVSICVCVSWIPLVLTLRLPPSYSVGVGVSYWLLWICFRKSDIFGLIGFLRSFLLLVLGSMCPYKSLFLALVLSTLFYAFHSERDVHVMSLRGLIKAIFLFKGVKSVFLVINCIKCLRLLTVRFFKESVTGLGSNRIPGY